MTIEMSWRGTVRSAELNTLHAEGFGHPVGVSDWETRLERHSLG